MARGTPLTTETLDDVQAEARARVFASPADRSRVEILHRLSPAAPEAVSLAGLGALPGLSRPAVSYHLELLQEARLISRDRRGQFSHYARGAGALSRVAALVGHDPLANAS